MQNLYKINGNPEQFSDLNVFHKLSQQFLPYAQERLGFDKPVGINLLSDPQNAKNPLGKTAYYDPNKMQITVFVDKRHVKDILRSMSHELVHHTQNCRGEFDGGAHTGQGYAQEDGHMRKMEEEAYLEGQMLLRDWEDSKKNKNSDLKENKAMGIKFKNLEEGLRFSKAELGRPAQKAGAQDHGDEEVAKLRGGAKDHRDSPTPAVGLGKKPMRKVSGLDEGEGHSGTCKEAHGDDPSAAGHKKYMEGLKENEEDKNNPPKEKEKGGMVVDSPDSPGAKNTDVTMEGDSEVKKVWKIDGKTVLCDDGCTEREARGRINKSVKASERGELAKGRADKETKNENWTRKNKSELLFERLVKKWAK